MNNVDLYKKLLSDSMRFFCTNRSGIAIDGGIAGSAYARPAGHVAGTPGEGDTAASCQAPSRTSTTGPATTNST